MVFFIKKDGAKGMDIITVQQAKKIIEGLGGPDNILAMETCFTRLRVEVKDTTLICTSVLQQPPCHGVVQHGQEIYIVYGVHAADIENQVRAELVHPDRKE